MADEREKPLQDYRDDEELVDYLRDAEDWRDAEAVGNADPRDLLAFTARHIDETPDGETTYFKWIKENIDQRRLPVSIRTRKHERFDQFFEFVAEFNASLTNALVMDVLYYSKPAVQAQYMTDAVDRAEKSFAALFMREINSIAQLMDRTKAFMRDERTPYFEYDVRFTASVAAEAIGRALRTFPSDLRRDQRGALDRMVDKLSLFVKVVSRISRMSSRKFIQSFMDSVNYCCRTVKQMERHVTFVSRVHSVTDTDSDVRKLQLRFKQERADIMRIIETDLAKAIERDEHPPHLGVRWLTYAHLIPHMIMKYHSVMLHVQNRGHPPLVAPKKRLHIHERSDEADAEDRYGVYDGRVYVSGPDRQAVRMPDGTIRDLDQDDRDHLARLSDRTRRWFD